MKHRRAWAARVAQLTGEPAPAELETPLHIRILETLEALLAPVVVIHHSPNGGKRDKRTAAVLKAMGTRAGWPDLTLHWPDPAGSPWGRCGGLEVKTDDPGSDTSAAQDRLHPLLRAAGMPVVVIRSDDEAVAAAAWWGVPMRGRIMAGAGSPVRVLPGRTVWP